MSELTAALTPDEIIDLTWFFTQASGDCGVRSPFDMQLWIIKSGFTPQKNCRRVGSGVPDHVYRAGERANAVAARLRRLTDRQRMALEAHFANEKPLGASGVTLSLACQQPTARWSHKEIQDDVSKSRSPSERRKRKQSQREHAASTIRNWLLYLGTAARRDAASVEAKVLGQIVAQARTDLVRACEAYAKTRPPRVVTRREGDVLAYQNPEKDHAEEAT